MGRSSSVNTLKTLSYVCGGVAIVAAAIALLFQWRSGDVHTIEDGAKQQVEAIPSQQPPRRVSADQSATLLAELHGMNMGLVNFVYANCADCTAFANDLVRVLRMAGATVPDAESGLDVVPPGVIVFVPDLEHPSPEASALLDALQEAGMHPRLSSDPTSEYQVTLSVGREPSIDPK